MNSGKSVYVKQIFRCPLDNPLLRRNRIIADATIVTYEKGYSSTHPSRSDYLFVWALVPVSYDYQVG